MANVDEGAKFIPLDWNDDERMSFMFSSFPKNRDVNPKHWDSKLSYWLEEVKKSCSFHQDICISCETLRERFRRCDRVPQGFDVVLAEMERQEMLLAPDRITKYLDSDWLKWSYRMISSSVSWVWQNTVTKNTSTGQREYICYEMLGKIAMDVVAKHYQVAKNDKTDHVVPWNVVKNLYFVNDRKRNDEELLYVIAFLKSKGLADLASNSKNEKLVKFAKSYTSSVGKINENDWNIVCLKKAIAKLKIESAEVTEQISKVQKTAQICLKQKDINQAKRLVYQKRKLERLLNVKQDSLMTLTDQLSMIQNTESNKMIVDAIISSASLLDSSIKEDGLSPEQIDEVFEKSIEASELAKEVGNSISQGFPTLDSDIDLDELEQELAMLMNEKDDEVSSTNIMDLPSVPTHLPGHGGKQNIVTKPTRTLAI